MKLLKTMFFDWQAVMTLRETNRDAFYGLLSQNIEAFLPIIYTPTVGDACLKWSTLIKRPTGLYISAQDKVCNPCTSRFDIV